MGYKTKQFFLMATVAFACVLHSGPINALPARRAFDTSPAGVNNVANSNGIVQDVDATIKEVEGLLNADPSLPRLTRGEILDIIENLTQADGQKGVARDPKAIMVVLPYSADSVQNGDFQSLYTKPPMTHIIEDGSEDERNTVKPDVPQKKRRPTKKPYQQVGVEHNDRVKVARVPTTEGPRESLFNQHDHEHEFHEFEQQQSAVEIASQKPRTTTENPFTRFINRRRKTTMLPGNHKQAFQDISTTTRSTSTSTTTEAPKTTKKRKVTRRPSSTTSTTTSTTTTTTVKPFEFLPNHGINIVSPPSFQPMPGKTTVAEFQPIPTRPTTRRPTTTSTPARPTTPRYLSSTTTTLPPIPNRPMMVDEVPIPEDFKDVLKSLDILIKQSPTQPPPYDEPLHEQDQLTEQDKLKLLFASLGVHTSTTTTSTTAPEPDVMQVANNLTPEMKDLLMTFGLIPDPNKDKTTTPKEEIFMEPSSVITADSYSRFKPLPVHSSANASPSDDMEDFLAKFGLVDKNQPGTHGSNRGQKAISMSKPQNDLKPNLDMIPEDFKDIVADIGFTVNAEPPKAKPLTPQSDSQIIKEVEAPQVPSTKKPDHVFNPAASGTEYATEDEINRLNQLMGVIKQFEKLNGTASDDDLKHIDLEGLKDLVHSFNVPLDQQKGPNPLDYDVGLQKNEVKRQTSTTEKPAVSLEPINPSLALLEDSFGGSSDTVSEAAAVETTTTEAPKKTGFYYLLDWNSFFDIDNQKGKRVNLRFQPKVGDPKRFFSVNVP